jgi:hypothetical protein
VVRGGIPVLLADESTAVGEAEHERLTAKAAAGGVPETGRRGAGDADAGGTAGDAPGGGSRG